MDVSPNPRRTIDRWSLVRRVFAYGGAAAMTPYLLIKVSWVIGALLGFLPRGAQLSVAGFVVLNLVTIGMSATGIALALALARPWGLRIPAPLVLACAWIGCGLLAPMLPYLALDAVLTTGDGGGGEPSGMPAWEAALIQASFAGLGVGLAVAFPLYLRGRWPAAFTGAVGDDPRVAVPGATIAAALAVGLLNVYWAGGGTLGLVHPGARNLDWRLLGGTTGAWALAGAWGTWVMARARPAGLPRWIPVSLVWLSSGFLVAWGCWKLPFALYLAVGSDGGTVWPEHLGLAAGTLLVGVVAGASMLTTVRHNHLARRAADEESRHRDQTDTPRYP